MKYKVGLMARLTKEEWEKLKAEYITSESSIRELAEKYNVSHSAINKKIKKENWSKVDKDVVNELVETKKVSKSFQNKVSKVSKEFQVKEEVLEAVIDKKAEIQIAIENNTLKLLKKQNELLDEVTSIQELEQHSKVVKNLNDTHFNKSQVNIQNNQVVENKVLKVEFIEPESK
jgi:predicted DNA-binding protein YlxM (UPF0122 family)